METSPRELLVSLGMEIIGEPDMFGLKGKLGGFIFTEYSHGRLDYRQPYHWLVLGNLPISIAEELCECGGCDENDMFCGLNVTMKTQVQYIDAAGKILIEVKRQNRYEETFFQHLSHQSQLAVRDMFRFVDDPKVEGQPCIMGFTITTDEGLKIFVETLKKHKLV